MISRRLKVHFLFLVFIFLILRIPYLFLPLDRDEGGYAYVAWVWSTGKAIPYMTIFDQKPPLTYVPYVVASHFFGNSFSGVRLVALIYTLLLTIAFATLVYKLLTPYSALISTFIFIIYLASIGIEGSNFNTELLLLLPLVIAFSLYVRSTKSRSNLPLMLLVGFFGGLSVLFKPVAAFPLGLLGVYELFATRSVLRSFAYVFGLVIPAILTVSYFMSIGALSGLISNVLYFNSQYVKAAFLPIHLCGANFIDFGCVVSWLGRGPMIMLPVVAFSFGLVLVSIKQKTKSWIIGCILFLGCWISIKNAGSKDFSHYFLLLIPGFSLLLGNWIDNYKSMLHHNKVIFVIIIIVSWFVLIEGSLHLKPARSIQEYQFGTQGAWFNDAVRLSKWIDKNTLASDKLLVWSNEPEIYYYSKKLAPGGFMHFYGFSYFPEAYKPWLNSIYSDPPKYIATYVDDPGSYSELSREWINLPKYIKQETVGKFYVFSLAE